MSINKAGNPYKIRIPRLVIVALRDERGSYNKLHALLSVFPIVALRDERGSYNYLVSVCKHFLIVALRDERGSYNIYRFLLSY